MIRLVSVDLGRVKVKIPVVVIEGNSPGKNLVVTAGMDGDEYASIDAAYELIDKLFATVINGSVTIIPTVNIPGFEAKKDYNPLDNKYPKHIFPGKPNGSSSQRLIFWLSQNFIQKSNVWVDLHGGAMGEKLDPFVYVPQTGIRDLDNRYRSLINFLPANKIIFDSHSRWSFSHLHKSNIIHLISEAGFSSDRSRDCIDYHKKNVLAVMSFLGMTSPALRVRSAKKRVYSQITSYKSTHDGLWFPSNVSFSQMKKGLLIGTVKGVDGRTLQKITADKDGDYLWVKTSMPCRKGETLLDVATS